MPGPYSQEQVDLVVVFLDAEQKRFLICQKCPNVRLESSHLAQIG